MLETVRRCSLVTKPENKPETGVNRGGDNDLEGSSNSKKPVSETSTLRDDKGLQWHLILNHASKKYLEIAGKVLHELKNVKFGSAILDCGDCKMAKAKRKPCSSVRHRTVVPFQRLHSQAMKAPDAESWLEAIKTEFKALEDCKTWKIIPRGNVPKGKKIMKTRWAHKKKNRRPMGQLDTEVD